MTTTSVGEWSSNDSNGEGLIKSQQGWDWFSRWPGITPRIPTWLGILIFGFRFLGLQIGIEFRNSGNSDQKVSEFSDSLRSRQIGIPKNYLTYPHRNCIHYGKSKCQKWIITMWCHWNTFPPLQFSDWIKTEIDKIPGKKGRNRENNRNSSEYR